MRSSYRRTLPLLVVLAAGCAEPPLPPRAVPPPGPALPPPAALSSPPPSTAAAGSADLRRLLELPFSTTATAAPMGIPRVLVSRQSIMLEGDASSTIALPPPERWALGVDGSYKGTGPNDLYLVPLAAALERIRQAKGAPLAVAFDASIPYRIVVEVLFTAGQADYGQYHLVTRTAAGLGAILTVPPRVGSARPSVRTLNLAVFVTSLGMAVKTSGGNVAPGCAGAGPGIALPRSPTGLDLAGLSACAALVRAQDSSFATETTAVVVANPGVPFGEVVAVMDALRVEPSGRVGFPDIRFGVAR